VAACAFALGAAAPASADLNSLKASCQQRDAADGDTANGVTLAYVFCDDGVPNAGGRTPNTGALQAVAVPQRYDGFLALPPKVAADPNSGADLDGNIALDIDVTIPDPSRHPVPAGGYPIVAMMHGCCSGNKTGWEAPTIDTGGERWHYSNAWFATRGYVVLTYTARGFVDGNNRGSTGETQIDSRLYEINDLQHLVGQLADDPFFNVDPQRVVTTGGSYGGGFSWMALTDPTWKSPGGKDVRLVATAPKYGWTDLPYSLIPNGTHFEGVLQTNDASEAASVQGMPKASINSALFLSGRTGIPSASGPGSHATFPPFIDTSLVCLQSGDPFENNPTCTQNIAEVLPSFYNDRSAYYQNHFFDRVATDPTARVPIFSAGTFTDNLFTAIEHRRMVDRLKSVFPDYPVQEFYGDYNHFVQNKAKEWGDVCGADRHLCRFEDHAGGDLNAVPTGRVLQGVTSRLNAFVDHYVKPQGNPSAPKPAFDVTGSLLICPQNADEQHPADEPGDRFTAPTFDQLAPNTLTVAATGVQSTTNQSTSSHAAQADPVGNSVANGGRCPTTNTPAGAGTAVYDSDPLPQDYTMLGLTRVSATHSGAGAGIQLNARFYELLPDGTSVMMDRGVRRVASPNGTTAFPLQGNGYRFRKGNRIRIELTQNDAPYVRQSNQPSSLLISAVKLEIPVREASASLGAAATGSPPPGVELTTPRLASDQSRDPRFIVGLKAQGEVDHYELEVRNLRNDRWKRLSSTLTAPTFAFAGYFGSAYSFRARAVGKVGQRGGWDYSDTVVPYDDSRRGGPRYSRGWRAVAAKSAWGQRLSRTTGRGRTMRLAFRGAGKLYLIARTSPAGGRALVSVDGGRPRVVKFRTGSTINRRLVATLKASGSGRHLLRLTTLGGLVDLDGVGLATR
jgi:predicted acyl esterase